MERRIIFAALLLVAAVVRPAAAKNRKVHKWIVPVVMEKATVRGKVVVIESRQTERRTLANLNVQIWTRQKDESNPSRLLYETRTDNNGMFSLPELKVGEYRMVVSKLHITLKVLPPSGNRNTTEPKILLIMIPKEVL